MDNKNNNIAKKTFNQPTSNNDQLGENASEEFKSEKYTNSGKEQNKSAKKCGCD